MSNQYPGGYITKSPVVPTASRAPGMWSLSQQASYQSAGTWPTIPDAQFNYVTMLLHGDGINTAQNNTFLDSSTNNFTITRNGNTTQGSFSPYGSNWSTNFTSATTSYMSVAGGSTLSLGTGDFTIEFWLNRAELGTMRLFGWANANDTSFGSEINASNKIWFGGWNTGTYSSASIPAGSWTHIAMTRTGGVERLFINGTLDTSATRSTNYSSTASLDLGIWTNGTTPYNGYISNFRVVKGTALYTSSFTPSTTPLTAISGTQALVCQSNRFKDSSANGFAITTSGSPSIQRFNPFGTDTVYGSSTIGGSGYFDGTGDYLTVAYNASLEMGSSEFTIDFWIYLTSSATIQVPVSQWETSGNKRSYNVNINTTGVLTLTTSSTGLGTSNTDASTAAGAIKFNAWNHVRISKIGTTAYLGANGVITTGSAVSTLYSPGTNPTLIGAYISTAPALPVSGYICDVRIVKGVALSTGSTYTVPTTPLTQISGTSLLCNFTNAAIYDNSLINDLETVGNAQISTSVKKYGTGSLYFDGTGDSLKLKNNGLGAFGTGDFTVEMWMNNSTTSGNRAPVGYSAGSWALVFVNATLYWVSVYGSVNLLATSSSAIQDGNWHHVAICRSGTTTRMFFDGVQATSATDTTNYNNYLYDLEVGVAGGTYGNYLGYIDDLRITKGYARYTTTFTPPTESLPNYGPY